MRTTLTLEDDVAERIADIARETHRPFKAVVNEALRRALSESFPPEPEFQIKAHFGQLLPGIDNRRLNEVAWDPEFDGSAPVPAAPVPEDRRD
jgi:hypothetical protein